MAPFVHENHPNAVRVRNAILSGLDGDLSKMDALLSPNAIQRAPGLNPLSGHYPARSAFTMMPAMLAYTNGTLRAQNEIVLGNDHYAVAMNRVTAQHGSRSLDHVLCGVWVFESDHVIEISDHFSTALEFDAFWVPDQDGD
jgi:hypothetical protein